MAAGTVRPVELVRRQVVAEPVAAVVGEPQVAALRMPGEAHAVAHTAGEHAPVAAVRAHADDGAQVPRLTYVAGRTHGDVQPPIRAETDVAPAVVAIGLHLRHHHRLRRGVQALLDTVETQDAAAFRHVQGAVAESHAVGHVQPPGQGPLALRPAVAVRIPQGVDPSVRSGAHEQGTPLTQGHGAGVGQVPGIERNAEAGRQPDSRKQRLVRRTTGHGRCQQE